MRLALVLATLLVTAGCGGGETRPEETVSVDAALSAEPDERVVVRGGLIADGERVRLCAALAESYPPQCGRPWLVVEGLDLKAVEGLQHAAGVSWREDVSLNGTVAGGVLRVSG